MRKLPILLILVVLCSGMAAGQAKRFSVDISISGDKSIESDLRSYIARELRSLGDVEVKDYGDLSVSVVAGKLHNKATII